MARPSKFNREEAIETAMQEIWRSGYEATSVKAMSEELGITRSSYYNAFGSREELFKEALSKYFSKSPDRVLHDDAAIGQGTKALLSRTFRAACKARAADPEGRGCMAVNSVCELVGGPHEELSNLMIEVMLDNVARIEEILRYGVDNGELPPETDCHAKALALKSLLIGLNTLSSVIRSEDELWLCARTTLEGLDLFEDQDVRADIDNRESS